VGKKGDRVLNRWAGSYSKKKKNSNFSAREPQVHELEQVNSNSADCVPSGLSNENVISGSTRRGKKEFLERGGRLIQGEKDHQEGKASHVQKGILELLTERGGITVRCSFKRGGRSS